MASPVSPQNTLELQSRLVGMDPGKLATAATAALVTCQEQERQITDLTAQNMSLHSLIPTVGGEAKEYGISGAVGLAIGVAGGIAGDGLVKQAMPGVAILTALGAAAASSDPAVTATAHTIAKAGIAIAGERIGSYGGRTFKAKMRQRVETDQKPEPKKAKA